MTLLFKNNATSRLYGDVLVGDGTIRVQSGDGPKFPAPASGDFFVVTIEDRRTGQIEIMNCTAVTGDVLTVTRAQEGTIAQAFTAGATVSNRFTAATIDYILANVGYSKPDSDARFVNVAGDTMTADLIVPAPGAAGAAANKGYVDTAVATKIGDAPSDANTYGRLAGGWVPVVNAATYTASDVLAKLLTVDGAGSGLDADLLDGHDSVFFATQAGLDAANANISANTGNITALQTTVGTHTTQIAALQTGKLDVSAYTAADVLAKIKTVDGPGSGLDADTIDGLDSTNFVTTSVLAAYAPLASPVFTGDPKAPTPTAGDNDTSIATTAFVTAAIAAFSTSASGTYVAKTGDTMTGTLTIHPATGIAIELIQSTNNNALLQLDKGTSGFYSYFVGSTNAKARWLMALGDTVAEAGSNAGSDFLLQAYDDTGANPQVVMRGLRSTGLLTVKADPTAALGIATKQYVDAKPAGAVISDTPPASPSQGQTWWESDTGAFYISFNDGNSTQWVQINGPMQPGLDAPNDGGEYVRVNGVWRLSKQSFYPTGAGGQIFTVPPAAKAARIYGQIWLGTQPSAAILRVSADGSTFLNGASDYSYGHNQFVTGSATTPVKQAPIASSALQVHPTSDNTTIPQQFDCDLMVSKPASPAVFGARWRGSSYHSNTATLYSEFLGNGYVAAAAATALTQLPAFQIIASGGTWAAGTVLRVEWVY